MEIEAFGLRSLDRFPNPGGFNQSFGPSIVIWTFCITQFADLSLGSVGDFQLSLQKVVGLLAYPIGLAMMDRKRVPYGLKWLAIALLVTYSIAGIRTPELAGAILSADISVLLGAIAGYALYLALQSRDSALQELLTAWTTLSVLTSIICILQIFGVFPLITVSSDALQSADELVRAVGLKGDANFQALMLVVGLVTAQHLRSRRGLWTILIFCGIVATFSRMGLILGVATLGCISVLRSITTKSMREVYGKLTAAAVLLLLVTLLLSWIGPNGFTDYFTQRADEAAPVTDLLSTGDVDTSGYKHLTSTETRAALFFASFVIARENLPYGTGPYQSQFLMAEMIGLENVSHNVYLEWIITGGIFGMMPTLIYMVAVARCLRKILSKRATSMAALLIPIWIVFAFAGLFLALTYNSIIWLPMVLSDWAEGAVGLENRPAFNS
ncbi:MAG: O-antigen ligase family protein [Acidobacteriaceae bacterium]